jgi:hypothetical protein
LIVTRPATAALRLISACRLSTSSSVRPTERVGTFRNTSGVPESVGTMVVGVPLPVVPLVNPVLVDAGSDAIEVVWGGTVGATVDEAAWA